MRTYGANIIFKGEPNTRRHFDTEYELRVIQDTLSGACEELQQEINPIYLATRSKLPFKHLNVTNELGKVTRPHEVDYSLPTLLIPLEGVKIDSFRKRFEQLALMTTLQQSGTHSSKYFIRDTDELFDERTIPIIGPTNYSRFLIAAKKRDLSEFDRPISFERDNKKDRRNITVRILK